MSDAVSFVGVHQQRIHQVIITINNNNNNVTYIAQIRQGHKCAATFQHQTAMFLVDF